MGYERMTLKQLRNLLSGARMALHAHFQRLQAS